MANNSNNKKKSSSSKYQKKAVKTATKMAKKNPKAFLIIILVLVILVGAGLAVYFLFLKDKIGGGATSSSEPTTSEVVNTSSEVHEHELDGGDIKIHFLELGNKYTGDCTYIKAGDIDILIDAGSRQGSAATIKAFLDAEEHCTDGKLEYVIATHAHQDHIAGFVGTKAAPGIFESYKIGTLIDFAFSNSDSALYGNYCTKRDAAIASKDIDHHYTALQCVEETDGAQKEYAITDNIKMTILDQKFYHPVSDKTYFPEDKKQSSIDENDFSVCCLFTNGEQHYLFTGDLEKDGEKSLVENNSLPEVELFKGGHHGSYTANTDTLLDVIKPKTICICCCAGSDEYTDDIANMFPAQAAINRMAKHTDKIYVTTMVSDESPFYKSMNGIITFSSDGKTYTVTGSNNSIILKDTDWFKSNRTWPSA